MCIHVMTNMLVFVNNIEVRIKNVKHVKNVKNIKNVKININQKLIIVLDLRFLESAQKLVDPGRDPQNNMGPEQRNLWFSEETKS